MNDKRSGLLKAVALFSFLEYKIERIMYFEPDHEGEHLCADNHLLLLLVLRQKTGNSTVGRNAQDREFS